MLIGEQPNGTTNLSATKTPMPPPVQMPDLIDTGDQDDLGTQSSGQESNGQNTGNSAHVSSVDDLLGGEPIADISVTADSNGSDPFADVSFHEAETKETNDLFSGLTVEEKSIPANGIQNPNPAVPREGIARRQCQRLSRCLVSAAILVSFFS